MEPSVWLTFFAAAWAISLAPGPGAIAAMSAGLANGFRRGYWVTAGLIAGLWTQLLVVALGLGVVVATSAAAFAVVKWLGVAYLVVLGVQQWRASFAGGASGAAPAARAEPAVDGPAPACGLRAPLQRRRELVLRGWMINAVNPKGTVFMLAVLPQFIDLGQPLALQYLILGATLGFTDAVVMAGYALLAARVLRLLRSPQHQRWMNRGFGTLFVLAGLLLAGLRRAPH